MVRDFPGARGLGERLAVVPLVRVALRVDLSGDRVARGHLLGCLAGGLLLLEPLVGLDLQVLLADEHEVLRLRLTCAQKVIDRSKWLYHGLVAGPLDLLRLLYRGGQQRHRDVGLGLLHRDAGHLPLRAGRSVDENCV